MRTLWQDLRYGARRLLKQSDGVLFESAFSPLQRLLCLPVVVTVALTCTAGQGQEPAINPNNVVPLADDGTVYPTARITDDWGVLTVSDGVLMLRAGGHVTKLHVAAPAMSDARPLQGDGWKLELKEGWTLMPGSRPGDFALRKSP